ncbi:MAG: hypothetical protein GXW85_11265 [Clostridia bacterium]|nr:hypothetical protein [Clostridia bacterium]
MQSAVKIDDDRICFVYKFAYRLSGNRKVAEELTKLSIIAHYNQAQEDNLLLLKGIWQEFTKYYSFIEFQGGTGIQKILLDLPAELRCGVILKDIFKYNYRQIAQILSISPQEAQKIVAQGRRRIAASRSMQRK